uniref:Putative GMP synthase [glutamine-hydrolyzing] n=1 Tax=Anthurium amnicola TaxID=1678845 RepID=A0A1D1Z255_9ARAE
MSNAKVTESPKEPSSGTRPVLRQVGNRTTRAGKPPGSAAREEPKRGTRKPDVRVSVPVRNVSADSSSSSGSSSGGSSLKAVVARPMRRQNVVKKPVKVVPEGEGGLGSPLPSLAPLLTKRRCAWITLNSDPLYVSFHDEEWGVPIHDDRKLFELLVLSQVFAELSWPTILNKRETFREMFDNFDPVSIAKFSEKKIISFKSCGSSLLSELKLRAVVENARQLLKVVVEFGSFNHYCWTFVNHKPIANGFRYARQVPVRTPKAEAISKDLMRRGFRCVGPTVVYSFMQAAGVANDHLSSCFRYKECVLLDGKMNAEETLTKELDSGCSLEP